MNIDKSRIIDKTVRDIVPTFIDEVSHKTWRKLPTSTINLLSRCILRYANSYGTTYQISQTKELTIISNKGQSYTLESYTKFLNLIIVDYQDPSEDKPMNTQPTPTDIKIGTHWERLEYFSERSPAGEIIQIKSSKEDRIGWTGPLGFVTRDKYEFIRLFKPRPDLDSSSISSTEPIIKRNLAFYKESGEPWTESELDFVRAYCGDFASREPMGPLTSKRKYAYCDENTNSGLKVYLWDNQTYPEKLEQVSYESIFGTSTKEQTKAVKSKPTKPKPVAQPEPNKPIKSENTFMSKIKASASATVDQNKQALVIASKMEAGRIINKQVLKQLTPHLPFFLQGYAKSPFAPFVAANLVAMVANHTGNSKLTKVSDLMLLGAADSGVAAFNLDKIVDDILSNIKLPAGILDDNDDN